jgi:hypothetical protein
MGQSPGSSIRVLLEGVVDLNPNAPSITALTWERTLGA